MDKKTIIKELRSDPSRGDLNARLAWVYEKEGKYEEAVKELRKSVKNGFDAAHAFRDIARIYRDSGHESRAAAELEKALEQGVESCGMHVELGRAYCADGRYDEALEEYRKGMGAGAAEEPELHIEISMLYERKGRDGLAVSELEEALGKNPGHPGMRRALGRLYFRLGENEKAKKQFLAAAELDPEEGELNYELGNICNSSRDLDGAAGQYNLALEKGYDACEVHRELGYVYKYLGRYDDAAGELGIAAESEDACAKVFTLLGDIFGDRGYGKYSREKAMKYYAEAVKRDEKDEAAHLGLGRIYADAGKYPEAEKEFKRALEINKRSFALEGLVKVYQDTRKYDLWLERSIQATELSEEDDRRKNAALVDWLENNRGKGKKKDLRIKLVKTPLFSLIKTGELDHTLILPLAVGQLADYMRKNGFNPDLDDLNIRINHDNRYGREDEKVDTAPFFDEGRIIRYCRGAEDASLDGIMGIVDGKAGFGGYDVVLLSVPEFTKNNATIMFILALSSYLKKKYSLVIIAGGFNFSYYRLLQEYGSSIDHCIKGQGEKPLLKLLLGLKYGCDAGGVPGLKVADGGRLIESSEVAWYVKPDFSGLPVDLYRYNNLHHVSGCGEEAAAVYGEFCKSGILLASLRMVQDCPYRCIFCPSSGSDKLVRVLSPERAVSYVKELKDRHGVDGIFFMNTTLNISKKYVHEFCDRIIDSGLRVLWCDSVRGDNMDEDLLRKMRRAGCIRLIYGMETGSSRLLAYIQKQMNLKKFEKILRMTHEAGIWVGVQTICGFPFEEKTDVEMMSEFLQRNRDCINTRYYNVLSIRDDSRLFLNPGKYGIRNIRPVDVSGHPEKDILEFVRYGFDEEGGLEWEEKLEQTIDHYKYLRASLDDEKGFPMFEEEHFLFYLYSRYSDKKDIARIHREVKKNS
ncbi:MAG: tetratricopeptide repeat protein [Elusimicrobia bacterium]|nr:tetratricopeptide repeat protein [Elusimicrobiota bacterium]